MISIKLQKFFLKKFFEIDNYIIYIFLFIFLFTFSIDNKEFIYLRLNSQPITKDSLSHLSFLHLFIVLLSSIILTVFIVFLKMKATTYKMLENHKILKQKKTFEKDLLLLDIKNRIELIYAEQELYLIQQKTHDEKNQIEKEKLDKIKSKG